MEQMLIYVGKMAAVLCVKLVKQDITVELLLKNGANVNSDTKYEDSPLCIACFNGYDRIGELLHSNGAETNLCDKMETVFFLLPL